ncbi:MAG: hypothetical protein AB1498_05965 [bacterium]
MVSVNIKDNTVESIKFDKTGRNRKNNKEKNVYAEKGDDYRR